MHCYMHCVLTCIVCLAHLTLHLSSCSSCGVLAAAFARTKDPSEVIGADVVDEEVRTCSVVHVTFSVPHETLDLELVIMALEQGQILPQQQCIRTVLFAEHIGCQGQ